MTTVNNRNVSPSSGKSEDPKEKGFFNRPRKGGKSFWDWLNLIGLLAIPLVVGAATLGLGLLQLHLADLQHQQDQQRALDQQQATTLQTYLNNIQDLLLNHKLLQSKPTEDIALLARARTLTALQGLDAERKSLLLQFIYDTRLIGFNVNNGKLHDPIFTLMGADLTGANLKDAILNGAYLEEVDLTGADLTHAELIGAVLDGADLTHANLTETNLIGAHLEGVHLTHTVLTNAVLDGVDLSYVQDLTQQQLDEVVSCKGAILPQGLTCHQTPSAP